jgi:hypothetical protein
MTLAEKIAFIASQQGEQEATLLAQALDRGVDVLYRESLIDAYLNRTLPREELVRELGPEAAVEIDANRDAIQKDIAWGLAGG